MTALSLRPMLSHATVFWDDEMESGTIGFDVNTAMIPGGAATFDTSIKFSGTGSLRLNYPPACQTLTTSNQCGGGGTRAVPLTENLYRRVYFRMSGTGPNPTNSGVFEISVSAFTKMLRTVSDGLNREWWSMGCCGSKAFLAGLEHVPVNEATNVFTSTSLADNRWYCIETHEQLNTPGVNNGVLEAWVDGVKVLTRTDILFRLAGNTNMWNGAGVFRQLGIGNIWWDRYATGDTRIGCLGATPASDTTRPGPPQRLVIR